MEMAVKHSDHNFYLFLEKNGKNEKCLELPDLSRKLIRFFLKIPPLKKIVRYFLREKNEKRFELSDLARKLIGKTFKK